VFVDYYETLQISPNADQETVYRVYRVQAQRFHPDNQETGDATPFRVIAEAYETLSDPQKRADRAIKPNVTSLTSSRRLPIRRRTWPMSIESAMRSSPSSIASGSPSPNQPAMGLRDLLDLLVVPREKLEFSLWYLKEGGYLLRSDSARHSITLKGVELIETLAAYPNQPLKIDEPRVA
jgi:curved DNA-binding protein CbpA